MRIGITERGDAALDMSWVDKLGACDGVIVITKNITESFGHMLLRLQAAQFPVILHATCTGWGGTVVEPKVPTYQIQMQALHNLIQAGFKPENTVLRIDPIIPSKQGMGRVKLVLQAAKNLNLDMSKIRVRISIVDEYKHVKQRLQAAGLGQIYPGGQFQPSQQNLNFAVQYLKQYRDELFPGLKFHCCAEPFLKDPDLFIQSGCISEIDLAIMGLTHQDTGRNPQNRNGCLCLNGKTELLANRHRCPHQCLYCYWKD